jgi:dynactin complex subunit
MEITISYVILIAWTVSLFWFNLRIKLQVEKYRDMMNEEVLKTLKTQHRILELALRNMKKELKNKRNYE